MQRAQCLALRPLFVFAAAFGAQFRELSPPALTSDDWPNLFFANDLVSDLA